MSGFAGDSSYHGFKEEKLIGKCSFEKTLSIDFIASLDTEKKSLIWLLNILAPLSNAGFLGKKRFKSTTVGLFVAWG